MELIAATCLVILLKLNKNCRFISPCIISNSSVNSNWSHCPETLNSCQSRWYFVTCDLEIWWMTLRNNRAHLLCCFKRCASFNSHRWIHTKVTVRKRSFWVKIADFLSHVKFDKWPWKTTGHLFYATSSSVRHFVAIGEFKLDLQFGNIQFGSKSTIFVAVWPWNLMDDLEKQ